MPEITAANRNLLASLSRQRHETFTRAAEFHEPSMEKEVNR